MPRSMDGRIAGFGSRPGPVFLCLTLEFRSARKGVGEFFPEYFVAGGWLKSFSLGLEGVKAFLFRSSRSRDSLRLSLGKLILLFSFKLESLEIFAVLFV